MEKVFHFIYRILCRPGCITTFEFFAVKLYIRQGFRKRDLRNGAAVGVFFAPVLEQATVRRNHKVAFYHCIAVFDIDDLLWLAWLFDVLASNKRSQQILVRLRRKNRPLLRQQRHASAREGPQEGILRQGPLRRTHGT